MRSILCVCGYLCLLLIHLWCKRSKGCHHNLTREDMLTHIHRPLKENVVYFGRILTKGKPIIDKCQVVISSPWQWFGHRCFLRCKLTNNRYLVLWKLMEWQVHVNLAPKICLIFSALICTGPLKRWSQVKTKVAWYCVLVYLFRAIELIHKALLT